MKDWKETVLTDVTSKIGDGLHGTPKYDNEGEYYFINGNNLVDGKIIIKPETKKVSKSEFLKHQKPLSSNTILLGINGTFGNVAFYNNEKCILGKSACYINVNEKVDKKFLYYNFLNKDFQLFLESIATGTTIPNVPLKGLREYTFILPPISEQQSIAEVLSSLDDKIDLLHRQNKTLEQMAETLFRQWFVEEEKDEWSETVIDQVALINPETISKKFEFTRIEYLDTGSITKGSIDSFLEVDLSEAPSRAQRRVIDNDIVFSLVRPNQCHYGILNGTKPNTIVSTGFCVIRANKISPYFLYYLLTNQTNVEYLHSIAEGSTSTYPSLRPEDIAKFTFNLPPENKCNAFHEHVSSYWHKIFANQRQIKKIESMRDILLPKLMNGTVRVTNN